MFVYEKDKKLNINFNSNLPREADVSVWKDLYGTHTKIGNKIYGDTPAINKVEDYLYEIEFNDVDEQYAYKHISLRDIMGACSSMRVGKYYIRSYDWYYDNKVTWATRQIEKNDTIPYIGASQCKVTKNIAENNQYDEAYKLLPFETLDGINKYGVCCNTNVVPSGDAGITTGTNPNGKDLYNLFIPRLILTKATSARHAITLIQNRNVKAISLGSSIIELHFTVCDATSSYIVEFYNNKMHVLSDQQDEFDNIPNNKCIMTNFYETGWNGQVKAVFLGDSEEEVKATGLTPHADGLERYMILANLYDSVNSIESAKSAIQSVLYTKTYDKSIEPFWCSEFLGPHNTIYTEKQQILDTAEQYIEMFNNRDRDNPVTWQSVHQVVYDLEEKKMYISCQEGTTWHEYTI